jgi:hypothetical protein
MIINSGTVFRSISAQNELNFTSNLSFDNVYGSGVFGFSGTGGAQNLFTFLNGRILDYNNRHVWSYNKNESVLISGNIGSGYVNYFINQSPVCLYSPKLNNHYYNNYYIQSSGLTIDFNVDINGRKSPLYSVNLPSIVLSNQNVTGYIKNIDTDPDISFKLFSGEVSSDKFNYSYSGNDKNLLYPLSSGYFLLKPLSSVFISGDIDNSIMLTLNSNFGDITGVYNFKVKPAPIYFTDFVTGFTGILGNTGLPSFSTNYNYELRSIYPTNRNLTFVLRRISGLTGIISGEIEYTGDLRTSLSGFIQGYDYITGYSVGTGLYYNFENQLTTGSSSYFDRLKVYPTGRITYDYSLPARSFSKVIYRPPAFTKNDILGTGYLSSSLAQPEFFIYGGNDQIISYSGYASIEGIYNDLTNYRSNVLSTGEGAIVFDGYFPLKKENFLWSGSFLTGSNFSGYTDKLFLSGSHFNVLNAKDTSYFSGGSCYTDLYVGSDYASGEVLSSLVKEKAGVALGISGSAFASINTAAPLRAFTGGNDFFNFNSTTGFIGFNFRNYSLVDSGNITHVGVNFDLYSKYYPFIFDIDGSTNGSTWVNLHSASGLYFYPNGDKWIKLTRTGRYDYYRLNIKSGKEWPHLQTLSSGLLRDGYDFYGIKNFDFYKSILVQKPNLSGTFINPYLVYTGTTGYVIDSSMVPLHSYPFFSPPGFVFESNVESGYSGWQAFNSNKTKYPFVPVLKNSDNNSFLGYALNEEKSLKSYAINFPATYSPEVISLRAINSKGVETELAFNNSPPVSFSGDVSNNPSISTVAFKFENSWLPLGFTGYDLTSNDKPYIDTESYTGQKVFNYKKYQDILPDNQSWESQYLGFGFNYELSPNGNVLAVGVDDYGVTGSVWIYLYNGSYWYLNQKINNPAPFVNRNFGQVISFTPDGKHLAIGSPDALGTTGYVNIYANTFSSTLTYSALANFGVLNLRSLKFNSTAQRLYVGSPNDNTNGGSVRVFLKTSTSDPNSMYALNHTIVGDRSNSSFGQRIELKDGASPKIFIGAPNHNLYGTNAGAVYYFDLDSNGSALGPRKILYGDVTGHTINTFNTNQDFFGNTIRINSSGTALFVGGYGDIRTAGDGQRGALWAFTGDGTASNTFILKQKLISPKTDDYKIGDKNIIVSNNTSILMAGSSNYPVIFSGDASKGWSYIKKCTVQGIDDLTEFTDGQFQCFSTTGPLIMRTLQYNYIDAGRVNILNPSK